jgi:hypothetical protein
MSLILSLFPQALLPLKKGAPLRSSEHFAGAFDDEEDSESGDSDTGTAPLPPFVNTHHPHPVQVTQDQVEGFMAVTGASAFQASQVIGTALRMGLSMDHAVEYYFTHQSQ